MTAESHATTPLTTDEITNERAVRGNRHPSLLLGWKAIAASLNISRQAATDWKNAGMPVFCWGRKGVAAYADRLANWAATHRRHGPSSK